MSTAGPPFPPVVPRAGWRAHGTALTRQATGLRRRAEELGIALDAGAAAGADDPRDRLLAMAAACARELDGGDTGPRRSATLARLAADAHRLADELSEHDMVGRARRLAECERGLDRLRDITTTAGLIDGVCDELIRSLGFVRTMLARVQAGMWRPWKGNAALFDEPWVPDWIEAAIPLDELTLETRLLSERRPELVTDTTTGTAAIVRAAGVTSYVVAPIMPSGLVVGFFHADHGAGGRRCDLADRDILWNFAEGFGHLYERTALLEQLQTRREQVRKALAGVDEAIDVLTDAELELTSDVEGPVPVEGSTAVRPRVSRRLEGLTPRELEVLELVVAGARNGDIAGRLLITEGTVKSHVRSILTKLGVVNRSQAIALYLGVR